MAQINDWLVSMECRIMNLCSVVGAALKRTVKPRWLTDMECFKDMAKTSKDKKGETGSTAGSSSDGETDPLRAAARARRPRSYGAENTR
jgi:hypothetical protein